MTLSITQRRRFSAQGHALNPIVIIGKAGLTKSVLEELDRGLFSHELIKIKVHLGDRDTRKSMLDTICQELNAVPIQQIGKTFVIYRPRPEDIDQKKARTIKTRQQKREPRRTKRSYQN
ncbi:YhbY family RNA-binding protein [Nitrosomonas sp.]|uniref:YhbY family RNA-binding protein n=1 Tax=Nitrosomonas sp. TaxID=42353 RepID=UPI00284F0019|nr:YhbY family RNA-binding protein [Nitrosomonas sp.]MDR4514097.1 YhbY family RNA-binding protein [Nitrosomonas sp.]